MFLALVLLGWAGLRVATFEAPWPLLPAIEQQVPTFERLARTEDQRSIETDIAEPRALGAPERRTWDRAPIRPSLERPLAPTLERVLPGSIASRTLDSFAHDRRAAGHNVLWSAAMAQLPMPASVAALFDRSASESQPPLETSRPPSRWRVDGWLLLRGGGIAGAAGGQQVPSYGASQLGAVLAYRLAPQSPRAPSVYLRASHALIDRSESEAALGLSLRPLPRLPLTAHAELRATRRPDGTELRPAVFVAGGFERDGLPLGLRARGYAAGGYVGGDFATAFADGQAAVDAEVVRFDLGALRAGAGSWGGAQRGATRLDVGPTASLEVKLGDAPVRLSLDYRQRVAGDAAPASGASLTLSTGF